MLGLSFSLLRCKGSENQASTDRTPSEMKTPPAKSFFPGMSGMSLCLAFRHRLTSLWHRFFGTIALMEFVLKNPCQQLCSFSLAPCQRSNACPMAQGLQTLAALGCTVFRNNRIDEICPEKPVPTAVLGAQFFGTIALMEFVLKTRANSSASQYAASPQRSSPKLFPTVSLPSTLSSLPYRSPRSKVN